MSWDSLGVWAPEPNGGSGVGILELDPGLGGPKKPQAPCFGSSLGTLAQTLGLWQKQRREVGGRSRTAILFWASQKGPLFKGVLCSNQSPLRHGEAGPSAHPTTPTKARPVLKVSDGTPSLEPTGPGSLVKGTPHKAYLGEPQPDLILLPA